VYRQFGPVHNGGGDSQSKGAAPLHWLQRRQSSEALRQLESASIPTDGLRSKSCDEFAHFDAPPIHFVFTVCDRAANEACPVWPGHPLTAHWGVPDPAAVKGTPEQVERAFFEAFTILHRRITLFLCLPLATLEREVIESEIDRIGRR
jgi:arsenate reductase